MKKLLVSDYDGTFYTNDEDLKKNIEEVKKFRDKNNLFVIATGNNYEDFLKVIKEENIEYDYLILDQGSIIVNGNNKIIYRCYLKRNVAKSIYYELKKTLTNNTIQICNDYTKQCTINSKEITKILIKFTNYNIAKKTLGMINSKYKRYVNSYLMIFDNSYHIEIISNKTDKKTAIREIAISENINNKDIYTIGNGYNDISMIEAFNGFCLTTSVKELLEKCNNHIERFDQLIKIIMEGNKKDNE